MVGRRFYQLTRKKPGLRKRERKEKMRKKDRKELVSFFDVSEPDWPHFFLPSLSTGMECSQP